MVRKIVVGLTGTLFVALAAFALPAAGCADFFVESEVVELENPKLFGGGIVSFQYPSNWTATEEVTRDPGGLSVRIEVESPGFASMDIHLQWPREEMTPTRYFSYYVTPSDSAADAILDGAETADLGPDFGKLQKITMDIAGKRCAGVRCKSYFRFWGMKATFYEYLFKMEDADYSLFLWARAPKRNWKVVSEGFLLIYDTVTVNLDVNIPAEPEGEA